MSNHNLIEKGGQNDKNNVLKLLQKRIHLLRDLYLIIDNSSIDISIIHAMRAVHTPINKNTNHLAILFLIMNL